MKKKISYIAMVALLSLSLLAPVLATENPSGVSLDSGKSEEAKTAAQLKKAEQKKLLEAKKAELKKKAEERELQRSLNRPLVIGGILKEIKINASSTELVITVKSFSPKKHKNWTGLYPEKEKDFTVVVNDKTKFVRRYWGKSSLAELTVGDSLHINGKFNKERAAFTANLIKNDSMHVTLRVQNGKIDSINAADSSFVLKKKDVALTVKVDAKTKLVKEEGVVITFADLKVGDEVHARGVINTQTKVLAASLVRVNSPEVEATSTQH